MARQERAARASKRADQQADTIIAKSRERVLAETAGLVPRRGDQDKRCPVCRKVGDLAWLKANGHGKACTASAPQTDAKPRAKATAGARVVRKPEAPSDPQGAKCAEMRALGLSWMAIGAALGLPGAKTGAAAARKLYAAHTGQSHTQAPGPTRAPRASKRHAAQVGSKVSRREVVQAKGGFFSDDISEEAVLDLVCGRTIEWSIDLARLAGGKGEPEWADQDARVHPTDAYVKDVNGERCLNFRTLEGHYENGKPIAGPTRTVRLAAIHTVR